MFLVRLGPEVTDVVGLGGEVRKDLVGDGGPVVTGED